MTLDTRFRSLAPLILILASVVLLSGHMVGDTPRSSLLLLIDTSGSMGDPVGGGDPETKIEAAKSAALAAVEQASLKGDVEVAVLAFEGDCSQPVSRYAGFTTDFAALAGFIKGLRPGGGTPMAEAVLFANRFMKSQGAASARDQMIVLLADGHNECGSVADALNELRASGVIFRHETVGFGIQPSSPAARDLQDIATASGGGYHHAQDATQLGDIFVEFVNTFTVIDMLGMFGTTGRPPPVSLQQEETERTQQAPSSSGGARGQVTDLLGQFRALNADTAAVADSIASMVVDSMAANAWRGAREEEARREGRAVAHQDSIGGAEDAAKAARAEEEEAKGEARNFPHGPVPCGIPPEQAFLVTHQSSAGRWWGSGPTQNTFVGEKSEADVIPYLYNEDDYEARFACTTKATVTSGERSAVMDVKVYSLWIVEPSWLFDGDFARPGDPRLWRSSDDDPTRDYLFRLR